MQVVSGRLYHRVIQDSCETALNSSTDVLFTAIAEMSSWPKRKTLLNVPISHRQENPDLAIWVFLFLKVLFAFFDDDR